MSNQLKVCYFGAYDKEYARNRVLINGLKQNNVEVVEICERGQSFVKYFKLVSKYFKIKKDFDVMVVGFPGQEIMLLARLLTRKPIIFDAFTSHYGGYILDRNYYSKNSWRAKYYRWIDTWSCRLADMVLLDTQAHIDFFVKEFGLPANKFVRIFVGTDTDVFYPREAVRQDNAFVVHFHGHYIPLQGVETIIRSAKLLENEGIRFNLIGRGQTYKKDRDLARELGVQHVNFIENIDYHELATYMAKADVCLGIFGSTSKTLLVIPNKLFEALAMKKPVITADTSAVRELLSDDSAVLVQTNNPQALADGILRLKSDKILRDKVAENGYNKFIKFAKPKVLGAQLVEIIQNIR